MPPFSESEARALLDRVMGLSQSEGCSADLQATRSGNIRFARNAVSTSGITARCKGGGNFLALDRLESLQVLKGFFASDEDG